MWNAKRTILIITLICVVTVPVCSAKAILRRTKEKHPTAFELLDKYTETQNKLKSFILKAQTSRKGKSSTAAMGKFSTDYSYEYELRFDGKRASLRRYIWGKPNSTLNLTKDEALYKSRLWDGETSFNYVRSANSQRSPLGKVTITRIEGENNKRKTFKYCEKEFPGRTSRGYFPADTDRIDTILRKANTISVRDETENIGGADCYVIEADTKHGEYTVWIDPSHGYHIVKATAKRGAGNVVAPRNYKLTGPETRFFLLENVRFTKVDDVWVPMELDLAYGSTYHSYNSFDNTKMHQKVIDIILNPDHDALGSFVPDDIPDGARVHIKGIPYKIKYTWQNGQVVDKDGREVDVDKLIKAESEKVKKPKPKRK